MYRSYSVNNMPEPVRRREDMRDKKSVGRMVPKQNKEVHKRENIQAKRAEDKGLSGIFSNLQNDDIILLVILFMLLSEDCDDKLLIAAIGFIFLSDLF